jgi:hypothetical protein
MNDLKGSLFGISYTRISAQRAIRRDPGKGGIVGAEQWR